MKNVFLCGFMGCGKTTVGRILAANLRVPFADMDEYIEKKNGMTITEMFSKYSESYFRALEHCACWELSGINGAVIALGGGTVMNPKNVEVIKKNSELVFIDTPIEVIKTRLEGDTSRPLLQRPDREQAMLTLYEKRRPIYRRAATLVADGDAAPEMLARFIASRL